MTSFHPIGRFAPSPTGRMHLGNVFGALLSWLSVKSRGGQWLLRIEDIDPERCRQDYADMLFDDLEWLGLFWDGAPVYQSRRTDVYEYYFHELSRQGLTYPCYCSRHELMATMAPHQSDGRVVYPGTCRHLPHQEGKAAVRLMVPDRDVCVVDGHYGMQRVNLMHQVGDFIIRRKDGAWAYQLVVVIDDGLMGVTEVVRGRDLLLSSPQQAWLARLLGFSPPAYCHFPLLTNRQGQRLSKRDQSMDLSVLRSHYSSDWWAGIQPRPAPVTPDALLPLFSWDQVPVDDVCVELQKDWQGSIHNMTNSE